jgi:hypothetical protein
MAILHKIRPTYSTWYSSMNSHRVAAHDAAVTAGSSSSHYYHSSASTTGDDGSWGRYQYNAAPTRPPPANTVLTLTFTGRFSECGLAADCGCVPGTPRIPPQYFVPPEAAPYISVAELNKFAAKINAVLANNYIPMFPVILLHIVAVCVLGYYSSRMDSKLNQFIDSINTDTYVARNCHWYNFSKLHFRDSII